MAVDLLCDGDGHGVALASRVGTSGGHVDSEGRFRCGYVRGRSG